MHFNLNMTSDLFMYMYEQSRVGYFLQYDKDLLKMYTAFSFKYKKAFSPVNVLSLQRKQLSKLCIFSLLWSSNTYNFTKLDFRSVFLLTMSLNSIFGFFFNWNKQTF